MAISCGRVGRGGNTRFPTFQLKRDGLTNQPTDERTDKASYRVACPQLKSMTTFNIFILGTCQLKIDCFMRSFVHNRNIRLQRRDQDMGGDCPPLPWRHVPTHVRKNNKPSKRWGKIISLKDDKTEFCHHVNLP